jgi:hypothetical protein
MHSAIGDPNTWWMISGSRARNNDRSFLFFTDRRSTTIG